MEWKESEEEIEERLAFLGFTEADRRLLADLRPVLERYADRFVWSFYRHLLSFEETRKLLADPDVKERLLHKQREYLLSLAGPRVDADYVANRAKVGEIHEHAGLRTRWYLGAYALYFSLLAPLVGETYRYDPDRGVRTLTALVKLLMLDAQLAVGTYIGRRQEELDHLNRELAAAGRDLAREYEEQRTELHKTERRARRAEELASTAVLVAGLAHEIGTPMGVIRGHAEALESAVEGERAQWRLRTIREQIDRIAKIIEVLLNVARPKEAVRIPVQLGEVVDSTLVFVAEKLRRREIRVHRNYKPVAAVLGDPEKLQQLFLNLFLNAADAMPEGGKLRVLLAPAESDLEAAEASDPGVEIRVADTGVGIASDVLPHIFQPFYTTKPSGRGSGLGLMVAHNIVGEHGGDIEVSSAVGTGTEFCIVLPALSPQSPASQPKSGS
jgi:signal transduction histidine kinase